MSTGAWEQRHGRRRRGGSGTAWTPAARPTDTGPTHALPHFDALVSDVLTRRPGWPDERAMAGRGPGGQEPRQPCGPAPLDAATGLPTPSEMTATGLRKFDLGYVPASVTPPRSWRHAAWFAVGTSAAVVLGLTLVAAEFMERPADDTTFIDALPAYPSGPMTLEKLPHPDGTTTASHRRQTSRPSLTSTGRVVTSTTAEGSGGPASDMVPTQDTSASGASTSGTSGTSASTTSTEASPTPTRRTVGPVSVAPVDTQAMGDRTEAYFRLVTTDPYAAHRMTAGELGFEGTRGIRARYRGVMRVVVQDITIDRNQAVTTSSVRRLAYDGSVTVERRQLTFTWGDDPKILEDAVTE